MALMSVGRNAVVAENLGSIDVSSGNMTPEDKQKLEDARKSILEAVASWIPGDFVVSYGILLTAWTTLRASFFWMLIIAAISSIAFVVLGAFGETGFKKATDRTVAVRDRLVARTVVGFLVSVFASVAIPNSGWYDFKWFSDNELPVVVTAGVLVGLVVLALKGFQKRWGFPLGSA